MPLSTIIGALLQISATTPPQAPANPPQSIQGAVYHGRNGQTEVRMPPASSALVKVDGVLDEPAWSGRRS